MEPLTYPQFHALLIVPPLVALGGAAFGRYYRADTDIGWGRHLGVFLVIVALAVGYTTPWDNYLIGVGVWSYGPGTVAARVWRAPVSEYLFFVLQPTLTALWLANLSNDVVPGVKQTVRDGTLGVLAGSGVALIGLGLLWADATFYLGAILAWAGPVLALQWAVGWRYLWRVRRRVALAVGVPTLYLAVADHIALSQGIWQIHAQYSTGLAVTGVPIEEIVFFLVTNTFVVQGLVLFPWVVTQWREHEWATDSTTAEGQLLARAQAIARWRKHG